MKNIKRILLAFVAVFEQSSWWHVVPKVIMGLMSTNQQKLNSRRFLKSRAYQGSQLESIGDVINFEVSIKIQRF